MNNTKNPKNTNNNILIIASVIFVTVAVIVFVISLSLFNSGNNGGENSSSLPQGSSSISENSSDIENSPSTPEDSSDPGSGTADSSPSGNTSSEDETDISRAQVIIENARLLIGTPFLYGGIDADGFDSSGFIYFVMRESGYISCPRNIVEQSKMGVMREFDEIKEGDILFFSNEIGGEPNFAGFYSGNGKMIGCLITSDFEGVSEVNLSDYYRSHFVAGVGIS